MTPPARATAILNPETGRRRAADLERMLQQTLERRFELTVVRSRFPGDARQLAREAACAAEVVIAVGGDGTVAEVASGIIDTSATLAIVPTGSTNVIARGLGIPLRPASAARLLLRPTKLRYLDVAVCGDRVALHMAGSGLDALMMRDANRSLKRLAAWVAYVPPALRHLAGQSWRFDLTIDGVSSQYDAGMVLVANGSFVLNQWFPVGRDIRPDDGVLDVLIFAPPHRLASVSMVLWLIAGRVFQSRHFIQLRGSSVRIAADPAAPVEIDGDYIGETPVELSVRPGAIAFVVPDQPGAIACDPTVADTRGETMAVRQATDSKS